MFQVFEQHHDVHAAQEKLRGFLVVQRVVQTPLGHPGRWATRSLVAPSRPMPLVAAACTSWQWARLVVPRRYDDVRQLVCRQRVRTQHRGAQGRVCACIHSSAVANCVPTDLCHRSLQVTIRYVITLTTSWHYEDRMASGGEESGVRDSTIADGSGIRSITCRTAAIPTTRDTMITGRVLRGRRREGRIDLWEAAMVMKG